MLLQACKSDGAPTSPVPSPFPKKAQLLSAATSDVPLGARVMNGMTVGERVEESACGPWADGLSEFNQSVSSDQKADVSAIVEGLLSASLNIRHETITNVTYKGVKSRQVRSLEALGHQSGTYVWKAWYVQDFAADVRSSKAGSAKVNVDSNSAKRLGIELSETGGNDVTMKGKLLAFAVCLVELDVVPLSSETRVSMTQAGPQTIGFDYAVQVLAVNDSAAAGCRVDARLFNPRSTVLSSAPQRVTLARDAVVTVRHTAETLGAGPGEEFNEVRDLITFQPTTAFEGRVTVQRSLFRARPSARTLDL